eukprot:6210664-Pleurochrysis_carterae.AAC.3
MDTGRRRIPAHVMSVAEQARERETAHVQVRAIWSGARDSKVARAGVSERAMLDESAEKHARESAEASETEVEKVCPRRASTSSGNSP